jgi:cytoskeleton protein RodZ
VRMDDVADTGQGGPEGPALAGALLRDGRERAGRTVEECATALRARNSQILALERGDLRDFGAEIYARGFLRSYARLVHVDEERVLSLHGEDPAYRGPVLPPREPLRLRRSAPGWLIGLTALAVVAGLIAAVLGVVGSRVPSAVAPTDPALESPQAVLPPTAPPADRPDTPEPQPEPEPTGPPVDLVLTFEAASWLEVLVDGVPVEPGTLVASGETLRFAGQREVSLRFGNAGGVRVEFNGEELGPAGRPGEVLRVTYGPDGEETEAAAAGG